jgi:hypothetical protein
MRLAPSSSKRWLACPASAGADEPDDSHPATRFGHVCHEAAAWRLSTGLPVFNSESYDGFNVEQMIQPYVDFVEKLPSRAHEVQFGSLILSDHGGTIDTLSVVGDHAAIVDLKSGKWKVPADESTQLLCYAGLVGEHFPNVKTFMCTIIQPRVWKKPKTVTYTVDQVSEFRGRVIRAAFSYDVIAGDHCRFCPLRPRCSKGQEYARSQPYWS